MHRLARCLLPAALAAALAATAGGCDGDVTPPGPPVARIELTAPAEPLRVGDRASLAVTLRDSLGAPLADRRVEWSSSAPAVVAVDDRGEITARAAGTATVTARAGAASASTEVRVRERVASIDFGADSLRLVLGDQRALALVPRDAAGRPIPPPVRVVVGTSDPLVAPTDSGSAGHAVRAAGAGRAWVVASADGTTDSLPVRVEAVTFVEVAQGAGFACAITAAGEPLCWGRNEALQLGVVTPYRCSGSAGQYCSRGSSTVPLFVSGGLRLQRVSAGDHHACGLTTAGSAHCWGSNGAGQLGAAATLGRCTDFSAGVDGPCSATPLAVEGGLAFDSLDAGSDHTCALTRAGAAYCWGESRGGKLGHGADTDSPLPVPVAGGHAFRSVSAGWTHTCGTTTAGEAWCWGLNLQGGLGTGRADAESHPVPERVAGGLTFAYVGAGLFSSCGLTTRGRVYCWGVGHNLGTAAAAESCPRLEGHAWEVLPARCSTRPVPIASDLTFTTLSVSSSMACALTADGVAYCWFSNTPLPTPVTGAPPLRTVSAGDYASGCGVGRDGVAYCWGPDLVARPVPGQR